MLFSVIVPVYKTEEYLIECVESVLVQEFPDFEVILVDDGSPDRCPLICDSFAEKDGRIRVIHQENRGLSAARNSGLLAAQGEYIVFLDSDDLLCEEALTEAGKRARGGAPDVIIGNIIYWSGERERAFDYTQAFDGQPVAKTLLELNVAYAKRHLQLPWEAYHSVYKRTFLTGQNLLFQEGLVGAEDVDFYLRVLQTAGSYQLTDVCLVKYRMNRAGSILTALSQEAVWGKLTVFAKAFRQAGIFPNGALMRAYFADYFAHSVLYIPRLQSPVDRNRCYRFVRENREILSRMSFKPRYAAARAVWGLMGLETGTELLMRAKAVYKKWMW